MKGDVYDELPPVKKGDVGWIEEMLAQNMGKWVELRDDERVTSSHPSGYKAAAWVKKREEAGFKCEFATRGTRLFGKMSKWSGEQKIL